MRTDTTRFEHESDRSMHLTTRLKGTDKHKTEQVLYLFSVHGDAAGSQWVAVHGPPSASYDAVATCSPVFGSCEDDIWKAGNHEWRKQPCMI